MFPISFFFFSLVRVPFRSSVLAHYTYSALDYKAVVLLKDTEGWS